MTDDFIVTHNTYTIIAGVMEKRRLGIPCKPLIAVPEPSRRAVGLGLLPISTRRRRSSPRRRHQFLGQNRKRLLARIATGDFDAIVIGHTSLGFIETAPEGSYEGDRREVEELKLRCSMRANGEKRTQGADRAEDQVLHEPPRGSPKRTDQIGVNLREMGVDDLTVDEMHEFKNLEYATSGSAWSA